MAEVVPLPARHERGEGWGERCLDRLWMGSGREVRERNTKSQTPSSREIPNFKFQNLSQARCLGAWDLELLWSLVFGALIGLAVCYLRPWSFICGSIAVLISFVQKQVSQGPRRRDSASS